MDDIRAEIEEAIKDGLSNHTGEWFNGWIMPGLKLTEEQLRDLLFYITKSQRLQDNITALIEKKIREARIEAIEKLSPYLNNKLSVEGQIMMTEVLAELEQLKDSKGRDDGKTG